MNAILDYRTAAEAVSVMRWKNRAQAFETLNASPHLTGMLAMMARAQRGQPLEPRRTENLEREGLAYAETHAPEETDD